MSCKKATTIFAVLWLAMHAGVAGCSGDTQDAGPEIPHVDVSADLSIADDAAGDTEIPGQADVPADLEADIETKSSTDALPDEDVDDVLLPPPGNAYEAVAFSVLHNCVGCQAVSICGWPPVSDSYGLTADAAPNVETGVLFAAERWEAAGRKLELETCEVLTGAALDQVTHPPGGIDVLDAGTLSIGGNMPLLETSLVLDYHKATGNYPSVFRAPSSQEEWSNEYVAGAALNIDGSGGVDWGNLSTADVSPEPVVILTPHTDPEGQIQSIPTDTALEITWSGAQDFDDMVISMEGFFCGGGIEGIEFLVMCHAQNDGAFVVPAELLQQLEWPMYVNLALSISRKVSLGVPGVEGDPSLSVRTWADVPIYHDPNAQPTQELDCNAEEMAEGFAGEPCSTNADCGGGCCLPEYQVYFHDNYCSIPDCSGNEDCPSDAVCTADFWETPWESYCAGLCNSDDDCRLPEYACLPTESGVTACKPNFW